MTALAICIIIAVGAVLMARGMYRAAYVHDSALSFIVGLVLFISGGIASIFYMT